MATAHARIVNDDVPVEARMAQQLMEMNRKLDVITEQMGHLYRRTVALEELKDELMRIAKDGMAALTVELSEIEHEFNAEEVQHLLRKVLRSTPRLIRLLDLLESVDGLVTEIEPLGKEVMKDLVCKLQTAEEKGYFRLAERGLTALDQAIEVIENPETASKPLGPLGLLGALRDPQIQTALGLMITILRQTAPNQNKEADHA